MAGTPYEAQINSGSPSWIPGAVAGNAVTGALIYAQEPANEHILDSSLGQWTSDWTVDVIIKTVSSSGYEFAVAQAGAFWVGIHDGVAEFHYGGVSGEIAIVGPAVNDDGWHHLEATYSLASGGELFVDGISYGTDVTHQPDVGSIFFGIGCDIGSGNFVFTGYIDEVRLSKVVRHTANFTPPVAPYTDDVDTVALWHLDFLSYNNFFDFHHDTSTASARLANLEITMLEDHPIGMWPLREGFGSQAFDISGNVRDGAYNGSVTEGLGAITGTVVLTSARFNGGYVIIPGMAAFLTGGAATLEAIVTWTGSGSAGSGILCDRASTSNDVPLQMGMGQPDNTNRFTAGTVQFGNPDIRVDSGVTPVPDEPHHLVVTHDGALITFYIDSAVVGTVAASFFPDTTDYFIGLGQDGTTDPYYRGRISEVAIYDYALDADRVLAHLIATGITPPPPPPAPWPNMDFPCGAGRIGF